MDILIGLACYAAPQVPLPTSPAQRRALAQKLVAQLDTLTAAEEGTLGQLGDDAFDALLPRLRADLEKSPSDQSTRIVLLGKVMSSQHTAQVLELLPFVAKEEVTRLYLLEILATKGDTKAEAVFESILQKGSGALGFSVALTYFRRLPSKNAITLLVRALQNAQADPVLRQAAFVNLPAMGGETVLSVLRAARKTRQTRPDVATFYRLTQLPNHVLPTEELGVWNQDTPKGELRATAQDNHGNLWGLFNCPAFGSIFDLWVARRTGNQWTDFVFTGASEEDFEYKTSEGTVLTYPKDWLTRYALNPALRVDRDHDGLTDLAEKRLGTDPANPDTDSDGLPDSQDKNPLAGRLPTTDREKALAAAFESEFGFGFGRGVPLFVTFPSGIAPFELPSDGWLVLPKVPGKRVPFRCGEVVLASVAEQTSPQEETFRLSVSYGPLTAVHYTIRVRKFGSDWFVVEKTVAGLGPIGEASKAGTFRP